MKIAESQGFGITTFFQVNSQVIKPVFGLAHIKAFGYSRVVVACRHAYQHQASTAGVLLGSGWFIHPLEGFITTLL